MTDSIRQAIIDSGQSYCSIEQQTGVQRSSIMRFVRDEQSLRLDVADKLAAHFGLEVVKRK